MNVLEPVLTTYPSGAARITLRPLFAGTSRASFPQPLNLAPGTGVEDVVLRQPRATRLADPELDEVERADLVAVGVDDHLQPRLARRARVHVREVEPVRLRVDLEEGPRLEGLLDHALDVDRGRRALVDLPVRDVADAVDVRVVHRREHARRRIGVEPVMDRRDNPVARREVLVGDVERAVAADVDLDPLQDPYRADGD